MTSDSEQPERSDLVATLIHSAGRRVEPPPDAYPVVFAAAEATWRRKVARRRFWRYGTGIAAMFIMLVVGTAFLQSVLTTVPPPEVARVDGIGGDVQTRPKGAGAWVPLAAGRLPLYAGTRLRTGLDGRADLSLEGGVSLRVATQTEIELQTPDAVSLQHGAVYADTGRAGRKNGIVITTPAGNARDLGTQFEVRFSTGALRLSVREGSVSLQRATGDLGASAGEQVTISAAGELSRRNIARDDPDWAWAETLVAMPDFDDQPVAALLAWVARGTDRPVRYADAITAEQAGKVILHGQTGPLAPLDALRVLLSTTNFTYEILPDGTIEVRYR